MTSPGVQNFQLLLEVFRGGLKVGIISKEEIVAWADHVIADTDEPGYFFIEVSLSHDVNGLVEVLNQYLEPTTNPICNRVLLGLIYHRQPIFDIDEVEKITNLVYRSNSLNVLTTFENDIIMMLYDPFPDLTQMQVELINFLDLYKAFILENYEQWAEINIQVLELLKEEEINVNIVNEGRKAAWANKDKKQKRKFYQKKIGDIVLLLLFWSML